jgi:hypothetical protein
MKKIVGLLVSISCLWSCSTSPKDTLFEELSASQTGVDFTNHILIDQILTFLTTAIFIMAVV